MNDYADLKDDEIDELLANKIMGWKPSNWCPTSDIYQAILCVSELKKQQGCQFFHVGYDLYGWFAYLTLNEYSDEIIVRANDSQKLLALFASLSKIRGDTNGGRGMTEELNPCPFCGNVGELTRSLTSGKYYCQCSVSNCGFVDTNDYDNVETAIEVWNTRPIEDELRVELTALKIAIKEAMKEIEMEACKLSHSCANGIDLAADILRKHGLIDKE
jgi:hypothetical protein